MRVAWLLVVIGCAAAPRHIGPPFPRIASYRIETSLDDDARAMLARIPLAVIDVEAGALDPAGLAALRPRNPRLQLLAYLTSEEIPRDPKPAEQPLAAARFARIPPAAWLLDSGSTLAAATSAHDTRITVADPSAFSVTRPASPFYGPAEPTYLLVGDEHMRLIAIEGNTLVVERGFRSQPAPHPSGARIASHVVFFAGTWMLNITGRPWRDLLAKEAAQLVRAGPWTGVFLDVCFEDIRFLNGGVVDLDRDGTRDDPAAASAAWRHGFGLLVDAVRQRVGPAVPILANPGAQDCPHDALDGILLEGFPIGLPPAFLAFATGFARYLRWAVRDHSVTIANAYSPAIGFGTIAAGQDEVARRDYAAMRFGLAIALMGDGYYTFDNGVFGHYVSWWYDEYDGAGRGVGWLGYPIGGPRRDGDAWLRTFGHGLAIANPTDHPVTVHVPAGYRKLAGRQDPRHNDGAAVGARLTVASHDGYLLAR